MNTSENQEEKLTISSLYKSDAELINRFQETHKERNTILHVHSFNSFQKPPKLRSSFHVKKYHNNFHEKKSQIEETGLIVDALSLFLPVRVVVFDVFNPHSCKMIQSQLQLAKHLSRCQETLEKITSSRLHSSHSKGTRVYKSSKFQLIVNDQRQRMVLLLSSWGN